MYTHAHIKNNNNLFNNFLNRKLFPFFIFNNKFYSNFIQTQMDMLLKDNFCRCYISCYVKHKETNRV